MVQKKGHCHKGISCSKSDILVDLGGGPNPKKSGKCDVIRTRRNKRIAPTAAYGLTFFSLPGKAGAYHFLATP